MTVGLHAAILSAIEWQDFLTYCQREQVVAPDEDDHESWRALFAAWRESR